MPRGRQYRRVRRLEQASSANAVCTHAVNKALAINTAIIGYAGTRGLWKPVVDDTRGSFILVLLTAPSGIGSTTDSAACLTGPGAFSDGRGGLTMNGGSAGLAPGKVSWGWGEGCPATGCNHGYVVATGPVGRG